MVLEFIALIGGAVVFGLIISQLTKDEDISLDRNMKDKLKELPSIYKKARKSIKIATDFDERFFGDKRVREALKTASECGVEIKIISERPILEDYKGIGEIRKIDQLAQHIMIIDGATLRIEKPHICQDFGKKKDIAFILKGFPKLGLKAEKVFDNLWSTSTPVS